MLRLSKRAREICESSLSSSTRKQYESNWKQYEVFCASRDVSAVPLTVELGIEFLTSLHDKGKSYSSVNTARSALSHFGVLAHSLTEFGKHPLVGKFMKGVYKLNPPSPRYDSTWDVNCALNHLKNLANDECTLKELAGKTATLIALCSGQRVQTLAALDLDFSWSTENSIVFPIAAILKTSKPGRSFSVELSCFSHDLSICPVTTLRAYLNRTAEIRSSRKVFVGLQKPHAAVCAQTISRWLVDVLRESGLDRCFRAHSLRHASSSKAWSSDVGIDTILKTVGWTNAKTFASFYRRPVKDSRSAFGDAVLKS